MGFGRYSFRHIRTGKIVVIVAATAFEAIRAHTPYTDTYEFVSWASL